MYSKLLVREMRMTNPNPARRREIVRKAIAEMTFYIVYLVTTLILVYLSCDNKFYELHDVLSHHFSNRSRLTGKKGLYFYNESNSASEYLTHIQNVFSKYYSSERFLLDVNLMLGPPRLRQRRVREHSCKIPFYMKRHYDSCYGPLNKKTEETSSDYKGTKYLRPNYGYVQDLTYDVAKNLEIIEELRKTEWIDRATRQIVMEVVTFNSALSLLSSFKVSADVHPLKQFQPVIDHTMINVYNYWSTQNARFILFAIFNFCIMYSFLIEVNEMAKKGYEYFTTIWNYFDFFVLILAILCALYQIWHGWHLDRILKLYDFTQEKYLNVDALDYIHSDYQVVWALCVFLQIIHLFKYFNCSKPLLHFVYTMNRCSKDILGFFLMFWIFVMAFALVGFLMFNHDDYRDLRSSLLATVKMIVGKCDYDSLAGSNPVAAPIFFVAYCMLVFFVMWSLFFAIWAHTFLRVKLDIRRGRLHVAPFLGRIIEERFKKFKDCILRCVKAKNANEPPKSDNVNLNDMNPRSSSIVSNADQAQMAEDVRNLEKRLLESELYVEDLILRIDIILDEKYKKEMELLKKRQAK